MPAERKGTARAVRFERFGGPAKAAALTLLAFAMLLVSLDQYIVVVALVVAGGIAAIAVVAINLRPVRSGAKPASPCPRTLHSAAATGPGGDR